MTFRNPPAIAIEDREVVSMAGMGAKLLARFRPLIDQQEVSNGRRWRQKDAIALDGDIKRSATGP